MKYDEKEFLDLLREFKSEETKKARRNLSTISFIIFCASILGVRFTDVKVLGLDISRSSELVVLFLALVLISYWMMMFLLSWRHDIEIQKERSILLETQVEHFTKRYEKQKKQLEKSPNAVLPDYGEISAAVKAYEAQKARTKRAAQYGNIVSKLELFVPLGLFALAAIAITRGIICAL